MPRVEFDQLSADARVWIFAAGRALSASEAGMLLSEVDRFLDQWKAHGAALTSARDWRLNRFLAIGVDPSAEQASGCSVDGLFRGLQTLERTLATQLLAGGRVFYRDGDGEPRVALRKEVAALAATGKLTADTSVFDTTITDAGAWREHFERPARESWVASLVLEGQASQPSSRSATNSSSARNG